MEFLIPIALILAFGYMLYSSWRINKQAIGTARVREIYEAIRIGSKAYLRRQYSTILAVMLVLAVLIYVLIDIMQLGTRVPYTSFSFIIGALCSLLCGYIGMDIATRTNARTITLAKSSIRRSLFLAFDGGMVIGLSVITLSLFAVSVAYYLCHDPKLIVGLGFGASLAALFAQLGGGIYTKAADIGADLVGKVEAGIPEDDPRNPAVIADNVGDNVGDAAGREADLFESHTAENIGSMIIGLLIWKVTGNIYFVLFPLIGTAIAVISTVLSIPVVKLTKSENPIAPLRNGLAAVTIISATFLYFPIMYMFNDIYLYYALLTGLVASIIIYLIVEYYTGIKHRPVQETAFSSQAGSAVAVLSGLSVGLESTLIPILVLSAAELLGFYFGMKSSLALIPGIGPMMAGIYGTVVAARGILSVTGMVLALDGFGPIVDNAGGIAKMSGCGKEMRRAIDALDAVGNTTKALTKGYAMGCAALAALLLFRAYSEVAGLEWLQVYLTRPEILVGAYLGAVLPFAFSALAIRGVRIASFEMINEVRRQFRIIPGLMEGKAKPDYSSCVDISTRVSLQQMVPPSLLAAVFPITVGVLLGREAVGALLVAATVTGIPLAIFMNTGGATMDNAKKYIEDGRLGGEGSPAHKAAVVGDTVGDPLKDTVGPSLHVLVKMLNTLTIVFAPLFVFPLIIL